MEIKKCKYKIETSKDLENLFTLLSNFGVDGISIQYKRPETQTSKMTLKHVLSLKKEMEGVTMKCGKIIKTFEAKNGYVYFEVNYNGN